MKKYLLRYYDAGNLGDDLFIHIISRRYANVFSRHGKKYNRAAYNPRYMARELVSVSLRIVGRLIRKANLNYSVAARHYDLMIYIGGSLFIEGADISRWLRELTFYNSLSIPYYILGSNVGPYKSPEFLDILRQIFSGAQDVCFRDQTSYKLFKDLPTTRVASDIVFTLDSSEYLSRQDKTAVFSIINSRSRFDAKTAETYEKAIRDMTQSLLGKDYRVIYMSFCKFEGDETAIDNIIDASAPEIARQIEVFNYDGDIDAALRVFAACEVVVATRFHATILGLLFGKKVLPMAYSDKTTNILHDMKFKGDIIDIRNMGDFDGANYDFGSIPKTDIAEQKQLAEKQFQELDKVLTRRKN